MKKSWIISIFLVVILSVGFSLVYFCNHAYGSWGDDSPGYIYLWGRLAQHKPLVYYSELTKKALDFFADEKLARWTTPTHHQIISPKGYLASKYPIGLSLLMYLFSWFTQNDTAIYWVLPACAVSCIILVYLIALKLFQEMPKYWRHSLAGLAGILLGINGLFYSYAVSQPMREIPSILFLLLSFYIILWALEKYGKSKVFYALVVLGMLSYGFSINIRETSVIAAPLFLILLGELWQKTATKKANIKAYSIILGFALLGLIIGLIPSIINSVQITKYKEKFKKKDITSIAITSNFDHLSSFGIQNIFNNQGKFKPGRGGLNYYWQIIQQFSDAAFFLVLVVLGLIYLFKARPWLAGSLLWWLLSFLGIFCLWINPYSRYIMPLFPILAILGAYGLYIFSIKIIPRFFSNKKIIYGVQVLTLGIMLVSLYPNLLIIQDNLTQKTLLNKSISKTDLTQLKDLGGKLNAENDLLILTGDWEYGISETLEAHTGVQAIRFPLEMKRYDFNPEKVAEFFKQMEADYNNLYFWVDATTSAKTNDWLQTYYPQLTAVYNYRFSFEPQVLIYKL